MAATASTTPISTQNVFLGKKDGTTYKKLIDIKEVPDLGKAPNTIEVTTLSDSMKTYINGLIDPGNLEFTANYTKGKYNDLVALTGTNDFCVAIGSTGENGIYTFSGELSVWVKGGGTEAALDMGISIAPSTEIKLNSSATFSIS